MSTKQIEVWHPDADEPVRITPSQLTHFETIGWSAKNPDRFTKENQIKEVTNTVENQKNGDNERT